MKYLTYRKNIQTGDVLAWSYREKWWKSWYAFKINVVRFFTQSEYSHVGIAVRLGGRLFVIESVTGGVRLKLLNTEIPFYHIPWKNLTEDDLTTAFSVLGEPYSQLEAVKAIFGMNDPDNHRWECAEFVKWVHQLPCLATPSAVVEWLLAQPGTTLTYVSE